MHICMHMHRDSNERVLSCHSKYMNMTSNASPPLTLTYFFALPPFFLFTFFLEKGNNIFSKSNQNPFLYFLVVLLEKERRINCYSYTVVHWSHKLNLFFSGKIGKIRRNEANKPVIMIEYDMLSQKKERVTYAFRVKFFSIIINTAPFTRSL